MNSATCHRNPCLSAQAGVRVRTEWNFNSGDSSAARSPVPYNGKSCTALNSWTATAREPLDKDLLAPAKLANLVEVSVHTLSYLRWNRTRGPTSVKLLGGRDFYRPQTRKSGWRRLTVCLRTIDHMLSRPNTMKASA